MLSRKRTWALVGIALVLSFGAALSEEKPERAVIAGIAMPPAPIVSLRGVKTAEDIRVLLEDPAIRNAVGLSENVWDFTACDGVPGFGPIQVSEKRVTTTLSCAGRDRMLITSIEEHGEAKDVAADKLAQAGFSMVQARALCSSDREIEALALYDSTLRALGPMHAAR